MGTTRAADEVRCLDQKVNWASHVAASRVLGQVVARLRDDGVEVMPVKGIVTARTLYDDIAVRHSGDIDLRVRRRDFSRAVRVARAAGWLKNVEGPILWQTVLHIDGWEVDIECTIGPPGLCAISVDDMLCRAGSDPSLFGFPCPRIELHDHAVVLALNAYKDGMHPLPWALDDLHRILEVQEFDIETLVARARQGRVTAALWIVANWLATEHGSDGWMRVRDRIGRRAPSTRVVAIQSWTQRRGWPPKLGLLATAASSDSTARSAMGVGLALAGVVRGRAERARAWFSAKGS